MTIVPPSLVWLIAIVTAVVVILVVITSIETARFYSRAERKRLDRRSLSLATREQEVERREAALDQARLRLRSEAYDLHTQLDMARSELDDENGSTVTMKAVS